MATPTKPNSRLGTYILKTFKDESFRAYVPPPLPPVPPLALQRLLPLLEQANQALGRLDGLASILPDPSLFIYLYVRKEAVLSSQIEGTQSSFSDLMLFESAEAPSVPLEDVQEVSNYVAAMNHGLRRLREDFPLSLRLIREIHKILLSKGRGSQKRPGEFRETQNWIGGTRPGNAAFVPPSPEKVTECMGALEKFLHREHEDLPILVKTALVHVQFETVHPFLDGNGRLGRLLITFLLCVAGAIHEPILYLSLYFKMNRQKYYELLDRVRTHGDWETWLEFFLTGVKETAQQAADTSREILTLIEKDRRAIEELGRPAGSVLRVHLHLQRKPIITIPATAEQLSLSAPTVAKALQHMVKLGIVRETTGKQRHRLFTYHRYLEILNRGTELPKRANWR
jgi:Fic family protein